MNLPAELRKLASIAVAAAALGGAAVYVGSGALQASNAGWRELAEQRAAQLQDIRARVTTLESQVSVLMAENESLRKINLQYQSDIIDMRRQITELRTQVRKLY